MALKKHHKIMIGGASSIVIILLVVYGILLNGVIVKQTINHNELSNQIKELQADTQSKLNELTENLIETKESLSLLDESFKLEISELKASVGEDFSGIIEDAVKSVVTIKTDVGQGTGFIINNQGYIVTNAHVISGGHYVNALTFEQQTIKAELIGYNLDFDLVLLKIPGDYQELELADSDDVQIGEKVIAIGNPLGLQFSVSQGIVSGVHRLGPTNLKAYIQTDAALNPGNSGGPLINKQGEVIGINNFKIGSSESLGFALESNYIRDIVNEIAQEQLKRSLI